MQIEYTIANSYYDQEERQSAPWQAIAWHDTLEAAQAELIDLRRDFPGQSFKISKHIRDNRIEGLD